MQKFHKTATSHYLGEILNGGLIWTMRNKNGGYSQHLYFQLWAGTILG